MLEEQGAECRGKFGKKCCKVMRGRKSCEGEVVDAGQKLEDGQAGLKFLLVLEQEKDMLEIERTGV